MTVDTSVRNVLIGAFVLNALIQCQSFVYYLNTKHLPTSYDTPIQLNQSQSLERAQRDIQYARYIDEMEQAIDNQQYNRAKNIRNALITRAQIQRDYDLAHRLNRYTIPE